MGRSLRAAPASLAMNSAQRDDIKTRAGYRSAERANGLPAALTACLEQNRAAESRQPSQRVSARLQCRAGIARLEQRDVREECDALSQLSHLLARLPSSKTRLPARQPCAKNSSADRRELSARDGDGFGPDEDLRRSIAAPGLPFAFSTCSTQLDSLAFSLHSLSGGALPSRLALLSQMKGSLSL